MEPLIILFWTCIAFATVAFAIFVMFAWQNYLALKRAATQPEVPKKGTPQVGMATELQSLPDADKVIEALAKLTDSLSKAPFSVAALIAAIFFTLIALGAAALTGGLTKKPVETTKTSVIAPPTHCLAGYFGDGDHQLPATIADSPPGCVDKLAGRLRQEQPELLLLIGRCDLRELKPATRQTYTDNLSLSYQRALSVEHYLLEEKPGAWPAASGETPQRTVLLAGGASQLGSKADPGLLRRDRVVELVAFWMH